MRTLKNQGMDLPRFFSMIFSDQALANFNCNGSQDGKIAMKSYICFTDCVLSKIFFKFIKMSSFFGLLFCKSMLPLFLRLLVRNVLDQNGPYKNEWYKSNRKFWNSVCRLSLWFVAGPSLHQLMSRPGIFRITDLF